jgi:hypothetical protein
MNHALVERSAHRSPLEEFVQDYVEVIGGAWDEVEPQVYDLLIPSEANSSKLAAEGQSLLRVTFDPEAIPEHPGAQLASYGTPVIDRLLSEAVQRGRYAEFYLVGLNLAPHDFASRTLRSVTLAANLKLRLERVRALHFAQAVYWFQATFVSDQKEQEVVPVALDLHYGRRVRHLDKLLDFARLSEHAAVPLPEVRRLGVTSAYAIARDEVSGMLAPLANTRQRELCERLERQVARMTRYYEDLRKELDDQASRGRDAEEVRARLAQRRETVEREERLRIAELHHKNTLRVHLRLLNLLVIQQPKLLLRWLAERSGQPLEMVWDLLTEALEALPCPQCQRPAFSFGQCRQGRVVCSACLTGSSVEKLKHLKG